MHYGRDNSPSQEFLPWTKGKRVCEGKVAYPGSIIQSSFGSGDHGNFEVVVPLMQPGGHAELWHFFRDNSNIDNDWKVGLRITEEGDHVVGPASIIQSSFGEENNFEVVVPLLGSNRHAELWHFFRDNDAGGPWVKVRRITEVGDVVLGPGSIIQGTRGPDANNFEVVVPILGQGGGPELWHYFHDNSNLGSEWVKFQRVTGSMDRVAPGGGGVILESDFGGEDHHNFEVIVPLLMPHGHTELWHFWHDTDPSTNWQRGDMITASAGIGVSFITSDFPADSNHRNFEVLVEELKKSIVLYFRHNQPLGDEHPDQPWWRKWQRGIPPLLGEEPIFRLDTKKICQLTGDVDLEGSEKVVMGEITLKEPALVSHNGRLFLAWKGTNNALNLMFSDDNGKTFRGKRTFADSSDHGPALASHNGRLFLAWKGFGNEKLNVAKVTLFANTAGGFGIEGLEGKVVLGDTSKRGPALESHNGRLFLAWKGVGNDALNLMFSEDNGATFKGKRTFGELSDHAPALASHNGRLFLSWKGSGNENLNVAKVTLFASTAGGFGIEGLEGKVVLGDTSERGPALASHNGRLYLAWKGVGNNRLNFIFSDNNGASFDGKTSFIDTSDNAPALASHAQRLCWAWSGLGNGKLNVAKPRSAQNRTESRFGIRGTDLGTSFVHNSPLRPEEERLCFLFGDTWRVNQSREEKNLDSIAFSTDRNPDDGLDLTFNQKPPIIQGGNVGQQEFEVPMDGVSFGGAMFVFFSDGAVEVAHVDLVTRSIVAKSDNDGLNFTFLWELSQWKFTYISVDVTAGDLIGLPTFGKTLLIWGTRRYRSSEVYLAAMPLEEIASGRFIRYYAGNRADKPVWADEEVQAVPLFGVCTGELSVRWNPVITRWLVLYQSDNPGDIAMRSAYHPWGPWTDPVVAFHSWENKGLEVFMHHPGKDFLYGDIIEDVEDPLGINRWGLAYGPGLIAPLTRGTPGKSDIFFTMSTWNPYQVMLMTATLKVGGPELPEPIAIGGAETRTQIIPRLEIHGATPF